MLEEEKYVYVNESLVHGQGLFAKEDIPANTIFAYFGGFTYTSQAWNQTSFFDPLYIVKFADGSQEYFMHICLTLPLASSSIMNSNKQNIGTIY